MRAAAAAAVVLAALTGCTAAPAAGGDRRVLREAVAAPAAHADDAGTYELMRHDGTGPVTWPACRGIQYRVDTRRMPAGMLATVRRTMAAIGEQTGVDFPYGGTTTRPFDSTAKPSRPTIYLSFTDRKHAYGQTFGSPGEVGVGGPSAAWSVRDGDEYDAMVSGRVLLWTGFRGARSGPGSTWQSLIVHEVGHALNLAHRTPARAAMHASLTSAAPGRFTAPEVAALRRVLQTTGCDEAAWRRL